MTYTAGTYSPITADELRRAEYYWRIRQKSLEAYSRSIDPYSADYQRVIDDLFAVRDELERLQRIGWRISERDGVDLLTRGSRPPAQP